MMIKPIVKTIESIKIAGFSIHTQNSDEFELSTAKIPTLWQHFYASPLANEHTIYGVYSNYESDVDGYYTLTVGAAITENKQGLAEIVIQSGNYLVFDNAGHRPEVVIKTWQQIWAYFSNNPLHKRNFISDFELYSDENNVEVYIGIV